MSIVKELHLFQIITLGIFLVVGLAGVAFFATNKSAGTKTGYEPVIWGTIPKSVIDESMTYFREQGTNPRFSYVEYSEEGFEQTLLVAIANGTGPDAIIFPSNMFYTQASRLATIPNESVSAKNFAETYIDAGQTFAVQGGIKGFPLVTDPMVMYWNRDIFSSVGLLNPPKTWAEVGQMTSKIVRKTDNGVITRAFVALGEYNNVDYAKRILFTLMSQVGVKLTYYSPQFGGYTSGLINSADGGEEKSRSVLTYYTEFANPVKASYTWNRSLINSREAFLSGDLAVYFGPGSELEYIRSRNPNLNFRVAPMPQENQSAKSVHGKTYAVGALVTSKDVNSTITELATFFTPTQTITALSTALDMAPARRDVLATSKEGQSDINVGAIYESAVYAKDWVDPNPTSTSAIFKTMIESVTSGQQTLYESLQDASNRLSALFQQ